MVYNIEHYYQEYKKIAYKETVLPEQQEQELRRCFFGGFGKCLIVMRDEISMESEHFAIITLQDLMRQAENFFKTEVQNHGKN